MRATICLLVLISLFTLGAQPARSQTPVGPPTPSQPPVVKTATPKAPLDKNDDPTKIGHRNINEHTIEFYSLQKEIALGQQLANEVDRQLKFVDDPVIVEYVNRLGQNIVLNSDAKVPFTIKVVDSSEVNAFALPGGFFYVNKGLIMAVDNEAELVSVMAHEIGHVAARHGVEQASKGTLLNYARIPLIFVPLGGLAANIGLPILFLKFNRAHEEEADRLGAQYTWATGYDPTCMLNLFDRLSAKEKKKPGTMSKLFSDHPPTLDRADKVRALIARFPEREEYIVNSSEFIAIKAKLMAVSAISMHTITNTNAWGGSSVPTLKRRNDNTTNPDAQGDPIPASDDKPKAPPTLKRQQPPAEEREEPTLPDPLDQAPAPTDEKK